MLDDSKKFKWGAKKLNYVVGEMVVCETDSAEEVCSVGGTCAICGGRVVFPFPIDLWVSCLFHIHSRGFLQKSMKETTKSFLVELLLFSVAVFYVDPMRSLSSRLWCVRLPRSKRASTSRRHTTSSTMD